MVQWTSTTLGQETRWAYSTAPEPTRGTQSHKQAPWEATQHYRYVGGHTFIEADLIAIAKAVK